jgi:hypothetical protein
VAADFCFQLCTKHLRCCQAARIGSLPTETHCVQWYHHIAVAGYELCETHFFAGAKARHTGRVTGAHSERRSWRCHKVAVGAAARVDLRRREHSYRLGASLTAS